MTTEISYKHEAVQPVAKPVLIGDLADGTHFTSVPMDGVLLKVSDDENTRYANVYMFNKGRITKMPKDNRARVLNITDISIKFHYTV